MYIRSFYYFHDFHDFHNYICENHESHESNRMTLYIICNIIDSFLRLLIKTLD